MKDIIFSLSGPDAMLIVIVIFTSATLKAMVEASHLGHTTF